jgi:large subunit ribosomal protein L6
MSRVGKKPILIPEKTKITWQDNVVTVEGPKGKLVKALPAGASLELKDKYIKVLPLKDDRKGRAFQGLVRSLVANMLTGVDKGFERTLEINGIGYRASLKDRTIVLNLGYSHPINFEMPDGISALIDKNIIKLFGIDKELLGHITAGIRRLRPPEPYKGKGIKRAEERIQRKAGKTGTK